MCSLKPRGITIILLGAFIMHAGGCQAPAEPDAHRSVAAPPAPAGFDFNSPAARTPRPAAEGPASDDLQAMAQQDVDLLMQMRSSPSGADAALSEVSASRSMPSANAEIQWLTPRRADGNLSVASPSGQLRASASKDSAVAAVHQGDPPINQSPLFRDPPPASGIDLTDAVGSLEDSLNHTVTGAATGAVLGDRRLTQLLVDVCKELYIESTYSEDRMRQLLLIAATTLVDPERAVNPEALPGLSPEERELLEHMQGFFLQISYELAQGGQGADEVNQVITGAVDTLKRSISRVPQLRLANASLCTRVNGFGDYEVFDKFSFLAGQPQKAIVYVEIENFTSEANTKNEWVTQLAQELVIYNDSDGLPVWRTNWQSAPDVSKVKRRDFYLVNVITLPSTLTLGRYQLKVRVRDERSGAETETAIEFTIVADEKLAATLP